MYRILCFALVGASISMASQASPQRPEVLDSCGQVLGGFVPDPLHAMSQEEADLILSRAFPESELDSRARIDHEIERVVQGLDKTEKSLHIYEMLKDKPPYDDSADRIAHLRETHRSLALTLVALKRRRSRIFRPVDN